MRGGVIASVTAALCLVACSVPQADEIAVVDNASGSPSPATLAIAEGCRGTWNGEAVTRETLVPRGLAYFEHIIAAAGGIDRMALEDFPFLRIEAPLTMSWSCVAPWLEAAERSGFSRVQIAEGADDEAAPFLSFPLDNMPPPPMPGPVLTVGGEGRLQWNGVGIDEAGLRARLEESNGPAPPRSTIPEGMPPPVVGPPGGLELAVVSDATVGSVRTVLLILGATGAEPTLIAAPTGATPAG